MCCVVNFPITYRGRSRCNCAFKHTVYILHSFHTSSQKKCSQYKRVNTRHWTAISKDKNKEVGKFGFTQNAMWGVTKWLMAFFSSVFSSIKCFGLRNMPHSSIPLSIKSAWKSKKWHLFFFNNCLWKSVHCLCPYYWQYNKLTMEEKKRIKLC